MEMDGHVPKRFAESSLTRRALLRRVAGIAAGLSLTSGLLAACGGQNASSTPTAKRESAATSTPASAMTPAASSGGSGELVVYSWYQKWIKEQAIPAFEKETGIKVTYLGAYASNDEWWANL